MKGIIRHWFIEATEKDDDKLFFYYNVLINVFNGRILTDYYVDVQFRIGRN